MPKPISTLCTPSEWLASDDTGSSSKAIFAMMMRLSWEDVDLVVLEGRFPLPPLDAGDFGRCVRLLDHFPHWRERLHEMERFAAWVGLIAHWAELEALYREDAAGRGHKLYERIREVS